MLWGKSILSQLFKCKRKVILNFSPSNERSKGTSHISKVLFFGTDNFSLPSLKKLHQNNSDISVVTSFKSPVNCVRSYAELHQLPLYRWPITAEQCGAFDVGVVVSFGHMIPLHIINAFHRGIINVHASLLPRWRGAAPIMYAIMKGDTKTGVSIMKIEPHHFDVGPILAQREMPIRNDIYMPELHAALAQLGADLLVDTVNNLEDRLFKAQSQNNAFATYAPKITSDITEIVWSEQTALELFARHRALYGFKNLTTIFLDKAVQLTQLQHPEKQLPTSISITPGYFSFHRVRKSLIIGCAQGTQLEVLQLRMEGKKPMSSLDFNNGFLRRAKTWQFKQNKQVAFS